MGTRLVNSARRWHSSSAPAFDAVVVGGGHNGLVCAGYLAREGLSVAVIEQKEIVGGCVVTEEVSPGWRINTYGTEHYVIQNTPIVADLSLPRYGLRYYALEPTVFSPFEDGKHMLFHQELEKTLAHIAGLSKRDARAYEKFHARWSRVQRAVAFASLLGPTSLEESIRRSPDIGDDDVAEILMEASMPASKLLMETFETEYVASPIAFLGPAAVGQSPSAPGTGWLLAGHIGAEKVARPIGGSGALTQALAHMIEANGGTILTGDKVKAIVVKDHAVWGVETESGKRVRARVVASNADPKQTLLKLLEGGDPLGSSDRRKVRGIEVSPGFTFKADYLLDGLPKYLSTSSRSAAGAATFIAPSVGSLSKAHEEFSQGRNPAEPGLMVALHSLTDRALAPPGKHGLLIETRYTPYAPRGAKWTPKRAVDEASRLLEIFERYAPGVPEIVEMMRPITPPEMEEDVMIPKGNFMHADMTFDQMFDARPARGLLEGYAVRSVRGLYLCGAGAFPGGAISGVPGRNAALQIISELRGKS